MAFVKGKSGNPKGRPKGIASDKTVAMNLIFAVMHEHKHKFKNELKKRMQENPVKFYQEFVIPLQPKEVKIDSTATHKIESVFEEYSEELRHNEQKREEVESIILSRPASHN